SITKQLFYFGAPMLKKKIDGITFPNPVGLAAGFDYDADLTSILPAVGFGFMTVGTVTLNEYEGNPLPRLSRLPNSRSLLINKGFKSKGSESVIDKLGSKKFAIPVGISVGSTNRAFKSLAAQIEDIISTFSLFEASKVKHAYYELNISCPNTKGGQPFTTQDRLKMLLIALDAVHISRPVYLKMPIDLSDEDSLKLLRCAENHSVQGVVFGNLTKDKENPDITEADRMTWRNKPGNLSGKPTWHRSNSLIALTKQHFDTRFTIIGTGGIFSPEDAQVKLALGADMVQLITGMIYRGPQLIGEINSLLASAKAIHADGA
ncbi:MAG: hypothetical protein M3Q81_04865, partial [bacterium]|nr:hypothetical protein [bacterium]